MTHLLLLSLLLMLFPITQHPQTGESASSLVVIWFKLTRDRQVLEQLAPSEAAPGPQPAMSSINKNYPRNVRINDPVGARDPNSDTIDGRAAAIEKIVQESRTTEAKPVDGFLYKLKVLNSSKRIVDVVFWEYRFIDSTNPEAVVRRQFLCGARISPNKGSEIKAFALAGPSDVVSVNSLASKSRPQEQAVINRVEYSDGTIWQRKDWNFSEIRLTYQRAIATPWKTEMCRPL